MTLTAPWSRTKAEVAISPLEQVDFLAFWDSFDMPCATFEAIFQPVKLAPGAVWNQSAEWKLIK